MQRDQKTVLLDSLRMVQAIVDVISSNGWLKPALAAMELSQMITQGLWDKDSALLQIPYFSQVSRADVGVDVTATAPSPYPLPLMLPQGAPTFLLLSRNRFRPSLACR
jgi:hypothetical protein